MNILIHQSSFKVMVTNPVDLKKTEYLMWWSDYFEQWCLYYNVNTPYVAGMIFDSDWNRIEILEQLN